MKIKVTATDIRRGRINNPLNCPIARALRRSLRVEFVSVTSNYYRIHDGDSPTYHLLPKQVACFILAFDRGAAVKPFTFTLG